MNENKSPLTPHQTELAELMAGEIVLEAQRLATLIVTAAANEAVVRLSDKIPQAAGEVT